jgi:hypothetical protein
MELEGKKGKIPGYLRKGWMESRWRKIEKGID